MGEINEWSSVHKRIVRGCFFLSGKRFRVLYHVDLQSTNQIYFQDCPGVWGGMVTLATRKESATVELISRKRHLL